MRIFFAGATINEVAALLQVPKRLATLVPGPSNISKFSISASQVRVVVDCCHLNESPAGANFSIKLME